MATLFRSKVSPTDVSSEQSVYPTSPNTAGEEGSAGEERQARHRNIVGAREARDGEGQGGEQLRINLHRLSNNTLISWRTVINEDVYVELLELLELHCELIIARFGLLDQQ